MTAKQYLQSYRRLERKYFATIEEIKSIENEIISLKSPNFDERVQNSPKNDPIGEMVCSLLSEKSKLIVKITEYKSKMAMIKSQISEIPEDYCVVLLFRYILYKDWRFICESLMYSRAQANVIHGRALLEFDAKFHDFYAEK